MKVQIKQRFLSKVFMGLVLTSSLFHGVKASGTQFESAQSDDDYYRQQVESLSTESVKKMGAKIREYQGILAQAQGEDLVVFLGNTGSGKSTSINILGNKRLVINKFGAFELALGEDGLLVGGGGVSVTEYPQHLHSQSVGLIFDMPGFEDTGGATKDIVNAALTKYLLENAKSVRAVLTVSEPELLALRGKGLQSVLKHIRMLSPEFLNQSVVFLVNKLEPDNMDILSDWIDSFITVNDQQVQTWSDNRKVFALPKAKRNNDVEEYIQINKQTLEDHINKLPKNPTGSLNVAMTFGPESSAELERFFQVQIAEQLRESIQKDWPNMVKELGGTSRQFKVSKQMVLDQFIKKLEASEEIILLKPVGTLQYNKILSSFKERSGAYKLSFKIFIADLEVKEQQEAKIEAEKVRDKALADAKAAKEAEDKAREAEQAAKLRGDEEAAKAANAQAEAAKEKSRADHAKAAEAEANRKGVEAAKAEAEARTDLEKANRKSWWGKAFEFISVIIPLITKV